MTLTFHHTQTNSNFQITYHKYTFNTKPTGVVMRYLNRFYVFYIFMLHPEIQVFMEYASLSPYLRAEPAGAAVYKSNGIQDRLAGRLLQSATKSRGFTTDRLLGSTAGRLIVRLRQLVGSTTASRVIRPVCGCPSHSTGRQAVPVP